MRHHRKSRWSVNPWRSPACQDTLRASNVWRFGLGAVIAGALLAATGTTTRGDALPDHVSSAATVGGNKIASLSSGTEVHGEAPVNPIDTDVSPHDYWGGEIVNRLRDLGRFHAAAVQVPMVLLVAASVAELAGLVNRRPQFQTAARIFVWWGVIGVAVAAPLGMFHGGVNPEPGNWIFVTHRRLGLLVFLWAIALVVLAELTRRRLYKQWQYAYWAALFSGPLVLSVTRRFGRMLASETEYVECC